MSINIKKAFTFLIILTFIAVGFFGFMFMIHDGGMPAAACEGTLSSNCPLMLASHLSTWKSITFTIPFTPVILALTFVSLFSIDARVRDLLAGRIPIPIYIEPHQVNRFTTRKRFLSRIISLFEHSPSA